MAATSAASSTDAPIEFRFIIAVLPAIVAKLLEIVYHIPEF
jgi:hypothetical protein